MSKPVFIIFLMLIAFFISSGLLTQCGIQANTQVMIFARQGVLDLTDITFDNKLLVRLDGEWEFYWKELYTPEDFTRITAGSEDYISLPGNWLKYMGKKYKPEREGYATYRLKVLVNEGGILGLHIPPIATAFKCWLNNELVEGHGRIATSVKDADPAVKTSNIAYQNKPGGVLIITLQIANYDDTWGGPTDSLLIGSYSALQQYNEQLHFFDSVFFGIIFIFAIYHFFLFALWKKDWTPFLFGLCCLCLAFRGLLVGTQIITSFQTIITSSWAVAIKFGYLITYISLPLVLYYFNYRYPLEANRLFNRIMTVGISLLSLFVLFTPYKIYVFTVFIFQGIVSLVIIYFSIIFIRAIIKKREGSLITAIGFFFFSLMAIIDIFQVNGVIHLPDLTSLGFSTLILSQALVIALRFSKVFHEVERYSKELQAYSTELEEKVKERTLELEKTTTQKTNFFINFTHEIKTPLTLIGNFLEKEIEQRGRSQEIALVEENLTKLQRDVVNFLDIEKMNKGQDFYDHEQIVNLTHLAEKKSFMFRDLASHRGLLFTCELADEDFYLKVDPFAIDRVINNLITNAIIYTPRGGKVTIQLKRDGELLGFTVSDTGIGISEEQLQHLFKPYHQLSSTKRNVQGIGVGLSIVKKILDQINAEITVQSDLEVGSKFHIFFRPYVPAPDDRIFLEEKHSKPYKVNPEIQLINDPFVDGKEVILLVEDNLNMLYYLQSSLKADYNIYYAYDGKSALSRLEDIPVPDLIISDIMMDGMDGYSFYDELSWTAEYAAIPFFFLTARTTEKDKLIGLEKGAVDFIYKPFSLSFLKAKIKAVLKQQQAAREQLIASMEKKASRLLSTKAELEPIRKFTSSYSFAKFKLTPREIDVVLLLIKGKEYKEISAELHISFNTLKPYIQNIYRKLQVHNKVELLNLLQAASSVAPENSDDSA